jgi:hypothetical protein
MKVFIMQSFPFPCYLDPLRPKNLSQHLIHDHNQPTFLPKGERPSYTNIQNNRQNCSYRIIILTYLLTTPWSRVLDKLTGFQLVKKFPAFYGTRKYITASQATELLYNVKINYQGIGCQDRAGYIWSKMVSSGRVLVKMAIELLVQYNVRYFIMQ